MAAPDLLEGRTLDALSVRELEGLGETIREAAVRRRRERAAQLFEELREKADAEGITLEEVLQYNVPSRASRANGRGFQNPENPEERWHGRGRRPEWVKVALAAGKTLDELRVT